MIKEPENYEIYKLIFEILNPNQIQLQPIEFDMIMDKEEFSICLEYERHLPLSGLILNSLPLFVFFLSYFLKTLGFSDFVALTVSCFQDMLIRIKGLSLKD